MRLLFRKPIFLAVVLGHFTLDVFNSSGPILVTFLSKPLEWSTAQIGFAIGAYQFFAALTQPLFGWIDDKIGSRWLGAGSVAWTIGFLLLSLLLAQRTNSFLWFIIPFVLASVGSSAFHPLGTKHAAETSIERAATGTALFFLFGQTGLAAGPILAGLILDTTGISGMFGLAVLALPILVLMAFALRHTGPKFTPSPAAHLSNSPFSKQTIQWGAIIILALVMGLRSWSAIATVAFLPKLFQEMGWNVASYGLITGTFWMASAITGVMAGSLADRFGRRQTVFVTMFFGAIPLYFLPMNSDWSAFGLVVLVGSLIGASHSILVVIAQGILPGGKAFTSGVALGYVFGTGAIGIWVIGIGAGYVGVGPMIQLGTAFSIIAAVLVYFLPSTTETRQPQPEGVPA
ncbi:MAG: MFS transporter [Anaerolineae bacterium]|nr:MFS transporter [Anaerolineae bacterium]MCB0179578.1 MFS transporter [Anaerolineae bacterium]MCB0224609.1 MFS transporter [Anaerolineae bacterium]MCB9103354.1 MFS transporter [Anaerolineales bacterium]